MKKIWSTVSPLTCLQEAEKGNTDFIEAMVNFAEDKNPAVPYICDTNGLPMYPPVLAGGRWLYGTTPLHVAAEEGNLEVCQLIFENVKDKPDVLNHISDGLPLDYEAETPLHYAASAGHLEVCQLFIQSLKDKNPPEGLDYTPLNPPEMIGFT